MSFEKLQDYSSHAQLQNVHEVIQKTKNQCGRKHDNITLIAVSKTIEVSLIRPTIAAGQRHFGENRVQEAEKKWIGLREEWPDKVLHLIGPLQTNKVRDAVSCFDIIHSLDRLKLAAALAREFERIGRQLPCFVQVNIGEESQKSGVLPSSIDSFLSSCINIYQLPLLGLMCIPPAGENPSPYFALLSQMAKRNGLKNLSMGMSADYEEAIELGATHLRVGSAIFGARNKL